MMKRNLGVSLPRILLPVTLAAGAATLVAGSAFGANIVLNPGFEAGLTDWTKVGNFDTGYNYVTSITSFEGANSLADGNYAYQGTAGASQQLTTGNGAGYLVTVEWSTNRSNDAANQLFQVLWDGNVIAYTQGAPATPWTLLSGTVTGTGSDELILQGYSTYGYNYVDDISVTAVVPEPSTWALMLAGFAGLGFMSLRRSGAGRPFVG